ncbi:MAG: hypothetical protein U0667_14260 [Chloroflexota bacterium]
MTRVRPGLTWKDRLTKSEQRDLEVALMEARLRIAGEPEATQLRTAIAALKRMKVGGTMSRNSYESAVEALDEGIAPVMAELASLEKDKDRYPARYYDRVRGELIAKARIGDEVAVTAVNAYRAAALQEARELRAAAEAGRDPAGRMADEMERARLVASATDADVFAEQARAILAAGQPQRAAFLLDVALAKGWSGGMGIDRATGEGYSTRKRLQGEIDCALDEAVPQRQEARALEEAVAANVAEFQRTRTALLAKHGLGLAADGTAGRVRPRTSRGRPAGPRASRWPRHSRPASPTRRPRAR